MKRTAFIAFVFVLAFRVQSKPLDSVRVETINGKKFIIHRIDKGQGLYAIARRYAVDVKKIMEANPDKADKIHTGDLIRIPVMMNEADVNTDGKSKPANIPDMEVKEKGKPVNKSKPEKIISDTSAKRPVNINLDDTHANADSKEFEKAKTHMVTQGENLNKIAQKYKITPQLIYQWNGLKSNKLEAGQVLIVDGSLVIKPYEKWNTPNSLSGKYSSPQNILSAIEVIEETGFADVKADKGILHKNAPAGTLMLITNLENGKQCYVKVTGKTEKRSTDEVLILDNLTKQKLNAETDAIRIKIKYTLP